MICVPITAGKKKEALHAIERSCQIADFIELRMDLIGGGRHGIDFYRSQQFQFN